MVLPLEILLQNPLVVGGILAMLLFTDLYIRQHVYHAALKTYYHHFISEVFTDPIFHDFMRNYGSITAKTTLRIFFTVIIVVLILGFPNFVFSHLGIEQEAQPLMDPFLFFVVGYLLINPLGVIFLNLHVFMLHRHLKKDPTAVKGQVFLSTSFTFATQRSQLLLFACIWGVVFVLTFHPFFLGGAASQLYVGITSENSYHSIMKKLKQKQEHSLQQTQHSLTALEMKSPRSSEQHSARTCPHCNTINPENAHFCKACGTNLNHK